LTYNINLKGSAFGSSRKKSLKNIEGKVKLNDNKKKRIQQCSHIKISKAFNAKH